MSGALGGTSPFGSLGGLGGSIGDLGKLGQIATGGFFGTNATNQSPFSYNPLVGQANQTAFDNYNSLYSGINDNTSGFVQSALDPVLQNNATNYGNIMQDQGLRGIRGSSFGDQTLSSANATANSNVSDTIMKALMTKYGLLNQVNQGIAGMGNNLANQGVQAQGSNTNIQTANQAGNAANMNVFGNLMGAGAKLFGL